MPNYSTPRSVPDKFGKIGGRTAYPAGKPTGQGADLLLAALNEPRNISKDIQIPILYTI